MPRPRPWPLSLTIATLIVALLGMASPAQAAQTYVLDCDAGSWAGPFVVAPGETVTLDGAACEDIAYVSTAATGVTSGAVTTTLGGSAVVPNFGTTGQAVDYTAPDRVGSDSFYVTFDNAEPYWLVQITVADASNSAPPPWLQQYGRQAATDPCLAGWDPSWAEWVFERAGGYVCQRAIYWRGDGWYVSPSAVWGVPSEVGTPWDGR